MSTAPPHIPGVTSAPGKQIVLRSIDWDGYVAITDAIHEHSGIRSTYDGDSLELMTLSPKHERIRRILDQMVCAISREFEIGIQGGGSSTLRSDLVQRGLEPDDCFWIANASAVVGIESWDSAIHPPPDLAVEVDISSPSISRQPIYASLGVPELWRYDGESLTALKLVDDAYAPTSMSLAFSFLEVAALSSFVALSERHIESSVVREFTAWLRNQGFRTSSDE
jgi:Uma2 family endonuclease